MNEKIEEELRTCHGKIEALREDLRRLEEQDPKENYTIMLTRDRLAFWEGKSEGLSFALEQISGR